MILGLEIKKVETKRKDCFRRLVLDSTDPFPNTKPALTLLEFWGWFRVIVRPQFPIYYMLLTSPTALRFSNYRVVNKPRTEGG